jgi:CRP-like cAMP-binding protein
MAQTGTSIPLLRALPADVVEQTLVERRYANGDTIFVQGEPTKGLWFVLEGRVAVERVGPDGRLATPGIWVRGEIVGIAGLWDQSGYPASARALDTPTIMGWIARETALALHQEFPAFGMEISRLLAERLRYIQESVSDRLGKPMVQQVAALLRALSDRMGPTIALTHEDLAHIIGTHRETVSRAVQELVRRGVVQAGHGSIVILHIEELEAISLWDR